MPVFNHEVLMFNWRVSIQKLFLTRHLYCAGGFYLILDIPFCGILFLFVRLRLLGDVCRRFTTRDVSASNITVVAVGSAWWRSLWIAGVCEA